MAAVGKGRKVGRRMLGQGGKAGMGGGRGGMCT